MRTKIPIAAMALLAGVLSGRADVTAQGWYHFGEVQDYYGDSSGNNRRFQSAFSTGANGTGNANAIVTSTGVGGPLDATGWHSTKSLRSANTAHGKPACGARVSAVWATILRRQITVWNCGTCPRTKATSMETAPGLLTRAGPQAPRCPHPGQRQRRWHFRLHRHRQRARRRGDSGSSRYDQMDHLAIVNADGVVTFYVNGLPTAPVIQPR